MRWCSVVGIYFLIKLCYTQDESTESASSTVYTEGNLTSTKSDTPSTTELSEDLTSILFSGFYTLPTTETPTEIISNQDEENEIVDENITADFPRHYELERVRYINTKHPCKRQCIKGESPKRCHFHFKLEDYEALSKACYNCPYNLTDCYRPDCIATDGVKRSLIVVNRMLPGPNIEVCLDDEVVIDLENNLLDASTSIHWHGQHQRESPYMDGVPYVTQCPVPPRTTFRYHYIAATPGTHFWHSHSGTQRSDGVFGPMIVRKPKQDEPFGDLYDFDLSEHVITVLDWTHQLGLALFTAHHHSDGKNKPTTIQINGRGMFRPFPSTNDSLIYTPPASFVVQQGYRYRFRLINAGVLNCPIEMSIDNHTIYAISTDGSDIEPVEVDSLVSYAGERWDFILDASSELADYWIRFRGLMDCDQRFTSAHMAAVLHYKDAPGTGYPPEALSYQLAAREGLVLNALNAAADDPTSLNMPDLNSTRKADNSLKPLADKKLVLAYDFNAINNDHFNKANLYGIRDVPRQNRILTPQFNHISLKLQPFPLLSQPEDIQPSTFCNKSQLEDCKNKYCECTNVIDLKIGEVVELILIDIGVAYDANHPFHLHGHAFRVVAMDRLGTNVTAERVLELDQYGQIHRNLNSAVVKDTVTVPDGGYTIIRFIADNPGFWMFHCHIEFHVELGMAVLFKIGSQKDFPPKPPGFPKCGNYMPPLDNLFHTDLHKPQKENVVDFGQSWEYNTSDATSTNDKPNVISVSYWWPLHQDGASSSTLYCSNSKMILTLCLLWWIVNL